MPVPLEVQKYLARCPYELAHTIYYLGALDTARYFEAQPFIYEARTQFKALRDVIDELQTEKLSSALLRADANNERRRKEATKSTSSMSALTPFSDEDDATDEVDASSSSSLSLGPLRPISDDRQLRRPESASSSSSGRSSESSLSSGASSLQHSPPSTMKSNELAGSSSFLSPEISKAHTSSPTSSLLSPELSDDAPRPSGTMAKLRQQLSSSSPSASSSLTPLPSLSSPSKKASKPVNEKDYTGTAKHSIWMPTSYSDLLEYIDEQLESLDSLEAVLVAAIADHDDYAQEQSLARTFLSWLYIPSLVSCFYFCNEVWCGQVLLVLAWHHKKIWSILAAATESQDNGVGRYCISQ